MSRRRRSCIVPTTSISSQPSQACSWSFSFCVMMPVTCPPPAFAARAHSPISPIAPPPYTSAMPRAASAAPRPRAAWAKCGSSAPLEEQ